ncbi:hypothetical protein GCM10017083_13190 [Thalassobaculum fulvum]|uniref:O-antigen ligase-related domain-containing protein n=1 Tax=Thalassobaculum fulvum TaxID=1633335 RepID=A0A918XPZ3_9PROT|nr:O-antigen ligase family protein [Thalassobaculum fulvum]GHD45360.1 hypothetical protein GCM10017083_13190 [Thalassobaculum fulvum]
MATGVLSAGLFLFPAVAAVSKQAMAPIAIALAVALLAVALWQDRRSARPWPPVALLFAAFASYVAVFHLPPALGDGGSAETLLKLGMLALMLWLASAGWTGLVRTARLNRAALWALAGLALGSAFLMIELTFDSPLHRLSDGIPSGVTVDPARNNRPAVALLLLAIPLAGLLARRVGRGPAVLAVLLGAAPVLAGQSAAAWVAGAVAVPVYLAARLWPRPVLVAGGVLALVFVVAAPPILATAYQVATRNEIRMPLSFTDRLEIWDHAAGEVRTAPWLGHGLGSVKHLPLTAEQRARYRFHKAPSTHAHNAALQVWVEFGAIGIAAGLVLLGLGAVAISRLNKAAQAIALTTASALLVIGMLSFGLWQETWLGLIGVTIVLLRLAALPVDPEPSA